jgi:hypothetical protein
MPAAAIAAAAGAAAGSMIPGVDYDALEQLTSTQAAKQLGTSGGHVVVHVSAVQLQPVPAVLLHVLWQQLGTHATTLGNASLAAACWSICFARVLPATAPAISTCATSAYTHAFQRNNRTRFLTLPVWLLRPYRC